MKYVVSFTHVRRHSSAPTTQAWQSEICYYGDNYPEDREFDTIGEAEAYAIEAWKRMERIDRYNCVAFIESAGEEDAFVARRDFWKELEK